MSNAAAKVMPNGRLSIPAAVRRRAGMTPGAVLSIEEGEEGTVLRTDDQHRRWLQAKVRKALEGKPWPTVDEFLRDRRANWENE